MKKQLNYLWKGSLIGVGLVAPGASGGIFATILGLYDTLINAAKEIFTHPFKIIKELWGLLIGILLGSIFSFYVILTIIKLFPIPMTMLMVGFIIGSAPKIYQATRSEKRSAWDFVLVMLAIAITVALPFLPVNETVVELSIASFIILFIVGFIMAATLVIPGLSGSMVLMALGFYFFLYETVGLALEKFITLDFPSFFNHLLLLIPVGLGLLIGLFVLSKLVARLLQIKRQRVYCFIFGLLISSPFSIIYTMIDEYGEQMQLNLIINIIVGVVALIVGIIIGYLLDRMETKYDKKVSS